jgi:hypothetical protein
MVSIELVEEVLSKSLLPAPKHVYIAEKPVKVERDHESFWIMGAQKRGEDMVILSPYSTIENIIHETAHSVGFGEIGAQIIGKLGSLRVQFMPCIIRKQVKYRLAEEDVAKRLGLKEAGTHYTLREKSKTAYQVKHFILEV